jgi:hypothetical protein
MTVDPDRVHSGAVAGLRVLGGIQSRAGRFVTCRIRFLSKRKVENDGTRKRARTTDAILDSKKYKKNKQTGGKQGPSRAREITSHAFMSFKLGGVENCNKKFPAPLPSSIYSGQCDLVRICLLLLWVRFVGPPQWLCPAKPQSGPILALMAAW